MIEWHRLVSVVNKLDKMEETKRTNILNDFFESVENDNETKESLGKQRKQKEQFSDAMKWDSNIGSWYSEVRKENPSLTDDEIVKILERKYPYPD